MPWPMRGLQWKQAVEVIVTREDGGDRRGSGYLVRPGMFLTAAHVVAAARRVRVRSEEGGTLRWAADTDVAWSGEEIDVALLVLRETPEAAGRLCPAAFGAVRKRDAGLACSALGFPLFKVRQSPRGPYRDSFHAMGTVALLTGQREGVLELRVQQPEPAADPRRMPWQGMSGAAVWAHRRIIGVIVAHHQAEGVGTLTASRADRWAQRVDAAGLAALRAVGLRPRLRPAAPAWRNRTVAIAASGAVLAAGVAVSWPENRPTPLHFRITGSCTRTGQVLTNRSSGFTPGGDYTDEIIGPDGKTPPGVITKETANGDGSLKWFWPCSSTDQQGTYRVRVTDNTTHRRTDWVTFRIGDVAPYTCRFRHDGALWYAGISDTRDAALDMGSRGSEVAEAQCLLKRLGYQLGPGEVDGWYGAHTRQAVMAVQQKGRQPVDGLTGAATWHLLRTAAPDRDPSATPPGDRE
ncbi:peptidoglycan-binding domain-containing protein [Streptomyces morookaense]|uniref:Peptidoglycan-binding protein n=1 Tax=Streptomyces morookaense TaxID=1970 RepID=A0A7Y7B6R7_STRMO|nr:peptidoglycan-binding domain-containing protein [Streptomyces morookaense]NVK80032.1 peptidoglycan-binding protein [Streptomyces morookaense]GHF41639.1 hypothetical protein GCM10010359_50390 [Streptomyces morookaense]